jgi:hypothetical protein
MVRWCEQSQCHPNPSPEKSGKILRLLEGTLRVMMLFSVKILQRLVSISVFVKRSVILPCDNSNDLESLTTDVQRKLRSLDAVSNVVTIVPDKMGRCMMTRTEF